MQASTYGALKGSVGFGVQNQKRVSGFGELRNRISTVSRNLCVTDGSTCCAGLSLSSAAMGAKLAGLRTGFDGISMSKLKARSVQARASGLLIALLIKLFHFCLFVSLENNMVSSIGR